jgi:putative transcriptional regulator
MSRTRQVAAKSHARGNEAMMRFRLKADGRVVEVLADGSEGAVVNGLAPSQPTSRQEPTKAADLSGAVYARRVRARTRLTQAQFAAKLGLPVETVRNWEQGKRSLRGPARALLKLIEKLPEQAVTI